MTVCVCSVSYTDPAFRPFVLCVYLRAGVEVRKLEKAFRGHAAGKE